jgi:hypothetical protein
LERENPRPGGAWRFIRTQTEITPNKRKENIFSWKTYFTNWDRIRIRKVCVIALADYALACVALTPLQQVSLLLALDHRQHLAGQDRDQWICELAPLAASFAIALCNFLASS